MLGNYYFKAGVHLMPVFPSLNLAGFNANISSAFQVIQKLYANFTKLCLAAFCKFWNVWEEIVFLKGLVKFREIRNNVILKLEFEVKN